MLKIIGLSWGKLKLKVGSVVCEKHFWPMLIFEITKTNFFEFCQLIQVYDKETFTLALSVHEFQSNEGRGVFVWADFKYLTASLMKYIYYKSHCNLLKLICKCHST